LQPVHQHNGSIHLVNGAVHIRSDADMFPTTDMRSVSRTADIANTVHNNNEILRISNPTNTTTTTAKNPPLIPLLHHVR
jgi:hypothetical protein